MKKRLFALCATLVFAFNGTLPAQEHTSVQTIQTGHLRGIKARQGFVISLRQDATSGAHITVDSRLQPYLRAEVRDGILCLGFDQMPRELQRKNLSRRAEVTVSSLDELEAHSGAHLTGTGRFTASGECEIDVHSGATVTGIDITAKEVEIDVHSGALVKEIHITAKKAGIDVHSGARALLSGTTDRLEAETHSGATADLSGLQARNVKADASSGSSLRCWATESISGRASSGSSVRYKGGATHVHTGSSSGGSYGPMK